MKNRSFTPVYALSQGLYWACTCFVYSYTRVFLSNAGVSASKTGVVLAGCCLFAALLQPLVATLMLKKEKLTLRTVITALSGVAVLAATSLLFRPGMAVTSAAFLLLGTATISTQSFVEQTCFVLQRRGKRIFYPVARCAGSIGYAVMSKVLAALSASPRGMAVCYIACALGLGVESALILGRGPEEKTERASMKTADGFFKRNRRFLLLTLGQVFVFFTHRVMSGYFFDIVRFCGGSESVMGSALLVGTLSEVPAMLLVNKLIKKTNPGRLIRFGVLLYPVRPLLVLMFPHIPILYVHMAMQIVTYCFIAPCMPVYANSIALPEDRMRLQAFITASVATAGFFGFLLGGLLIDLAGMRLALIACSAISAAGAVIMYVFTDSGSGEDNKKGENA